MYVPDDAEVYVVDHQTKSTGQYLLRTGRKLDADIGKMEHRTAQNLSKIDKNILGLKREILEHEVEAYQEMKDALSVCHVDHSKSLNYSREFSRRLRHAVSHDDSVTHKTPIQMEMRRKSDDPGTLPSRRRSLMSQRSSLSDLDFLSLDGFDDAFETTRPFRHSTPSCESLPSNSGLNHELHPKDNGKKTIRGFNYENTPQGASRRASVAGPLPATGLQRRDSQPKSRRHSYAGHLTNYSSPHASSNITPRKSLSQSSTDLKEKKEAFGHSDDKPKKSDEKGITERTPRSLYQLRRLSRGELKRLVEEKE